MTPTERHRLVLDALVRLAPPLIAEAVGKTETCILSTRIGIEVLERFGVRSTVHPCTVIAGNARWREAMRKGHPNPMHARGSWTKGVNWTEAESADGKVKFQWPGHLVGVARLADDSRHLYDLTAGQLANERRGIVAKPFHVPLIEWPTPHIGLMSDDGSTTVLYQFPDDDRQWRRAPDWSRTDVDALVRAIHGGIAHVVESTRIAEEHPLPPGVTSRIVPASDP